MAIHRWPKGTSGNPSGRPAGSKNKTPQSAIRDKFITDQSLHLSRVAIKHLEIIYAGDIDGLSSIHVYDAPEWHKKVGADARLAAIRLYYEYVLGKPVDTLAMVDASGDAERDGDTAAELVGLWDTVDAAPAITTNA